MLARYPVSAVPRGHDRRRHLTVESSSVGIYTRDGEGPCLCHFDYERGKAGGYPEAHLQVEGESPALAAWGGQRGKSGLGRLHFPVDGRRYRPTLEDVIEFLVAERLAEPRDGWAEVIERERREYFRIQLRAAIRRDPETARQALSDSDLAEQDRTGRLADSTPSG